MAGGRRTAELARSTGPTCAIGPAGGDDRARELIPGAVVAGRHVQNAGQRVCASVTSAGARCPVKVGQPTWSSTSRIWSRSSASRSIVAGKHRPWAPNNHD